MRLTISLTKLQLDPTEGIEGIRYENVDDDVTAFGVESELRGAWDNGLRGRASYSYQKTEDDETNSILTNSPRTSGQTQRCNPGGCRRSFSWS